ncbi:chemotaxis protein CheA [Cupriavidus pampae]|uniref:Chemotaxis protein CheA n=1 Tax=Cupriavidus pampae TaxID=659251 RepID=A0ABM8WHY6_9BURK|nr:chemotaxis protein CheA [Cupriavidus pampae]CAG9167009.1 Chemotaxis protein CheA [Cupriavidus pampae]
MNMDQALQAFIVESRELLEDMESALLRVTHETDPADSINEIFRAAHTIKGSAGLFGLDFIVNFAHVAESVLDRVREGALPIDEAVVSLLLACGDHIAQLVSEAAEGRTEATAELDAAAQPLLAQLHGYLDAPEIVAEALPSDGIDTGTEQWRIALRFGADVLRNGMDPLSFVRYLGKLGTIVSIDTLTDAVPPLAELDAESCYLAFEIQLISDAGRAAIEGAFEFVMDDCDVTIEAMPEAEGEAEGEAIPQVAVTPVLADPANAERPTRDNRASERQSVRVDADKLDRLVDLVGELITASATAMQAGRALHSSALHEAHSTLAGLVQEVRDNALQLRMVKIGATFSRFQRVVHDVSREIGKDIVLEISGEDTELDKTVVEKIGDPLTHLVRNSMDHGIEPADVRAARGKSARGTVRLNAYHDSGSIVIEVGDDGGGLSREKILAKAIDRGLVEAGKMLSDQDIYALIFEPGFSTAEQITNLSGRGVGMDVVKRNITALRGTVSIDSEAGVGTTVSVRLPLTLAIINGFQVSVGSSVFVLPLEAIEECVEFREDTGHDFMELRGQVLPFVRLRTLFDIPAPASARQSVVVVRHAGQGFGIIVDRLLGEAQTVIKPLARMFAHLQGISGSSILGSGDVALILDVPALATLAQDGSDDAHAAHAARALLAAPA